MSNSYTKAYQSVDGQILYLDGEAYYVNRFGRSLYAGTEEEVLKEHPAEVKTGTRDHQTAK